MSPHSYSPQKYFQNEKVYPQKYFQIIKGVIAVTLLTCREYRPPSFTSVMYTEGTIIRGGWWIKAFWLTLYASR